MTLALSKFGLQEHPIENFVMKTVLVDKAVTHQKLDPDQRPFDLIQSIAKVKLKFNLATC